MLRVELSDILRTKGLHRVYDINEAPYSDEDIEFISPVRGKVTITNAGSLLLARGSFDTTIQMECSNCLADVRQAIKGEIEEQYTLSEVETAKHRDVVTTVVQDDENEVPPDLFESTVMNVNVLIRQAAILATPLRTLCKETCAGLCPNCGRNRNEGPCKCAPDGANKPFAQLADIFRQETTD